MSAGSNCFRSVFIIIIIIIITIITTTTTTTTIIIINLFPAQILKVNKK